MDDKIKLNEKLAYTSGILGQNMIYNFMAMYIIFYFTDLLGISTAIAGGIVLCASIWDIVNDPMMGLLCDKTRTKYGKFKPYLLIGPVIVSLFTVLCFTQFSSSILVSTILVSICYILWGMSYTIYDIPIWAISSTVSNDAKERNNMVTLGKMGGTVGSAIVTVLGIVVINMFGGETQASSYTLAALVFAVIAGVLMFWAGVSTKERIEICEKPVPLKTNIKTVTKNKQLLILMAVLLISNLVLNVRQVSQIYFVTYVWEDATLQTSIGISLIVGMLLGMIFTPKLLNITTKKMLFFIYSIIGFIASIIPTITGLQNVTIELVLLGISFFASGGITIILTTMLLDAVEYSEWLLGFRGDGIIFSLNTFLSKFAATISKLILSIVLIVIAYEKNATITTELQNGISSLIYLIPALSFLLAMIPMYFYSLSDKRVLEIQETLKVRRNTITEE